MFLNLLIRELFCPFGNVFCFCIIELVVVELCTASYLHSTVYGNQLIGAISLQNTILSAVLRVRFAKMYKYFIDEK